MIMRIVMMRSGGDVGVRSRMSVTALKRKRSLAVLISREARNK
jgi:hypothetical protein